MRLRPILAALLGAPVAAAWAQSPEACPSPVGPEEREEARRFYDAGTTSSLAEQWEEALSALEQASRLEKHLHELQKWLKADVTRPPPALSLALGNAYFHAGSLAEAERQFRSALLADPRSGDAHNNLAVVLMLTGRAEEAAREAGLAEKAGVPVSPRLLEEIRKRR